MNVSMKFGSSSKERICSACIGQICSRVKVIQLIRFQKYDITFAFKKLHIIAYE